MTGTLSFLRKPLKAIDERIGIETFKLGIVLATVYFVQGMGGLSNIPLLFYFKDVLHFDEAQMQYFSAITGIAWLVKPLFGFISDRFPIFGYRRKTYMVMMATLAASSWWGLAWMSAHGVNNYFALVLIFNLSSLGYAFVDVVCDAIMVERGQAEKKETAFVNLQWFALGIAGAIAAFSGGKLQTMIKVGTLSLHWVFVIAGLIPLVTAIVAMIFVNEKRIDKNNLDTGADARVGWKEIKEVFSIRTFWLLTAFIFFWKYSPSFGAVFAYYNIEILQFDPMFLGTTSAIDKAIFPLSIIFYTGLRKFFPQIKIRHYLYASIVISLIYYAVHLLFLIPEATYSWIHVPFYVVLAPIGVTLWMIVPVFVFIITTILIRIVSSTANNISEEIGEIYRIIGAKKIFILLWLVVIPLSFTSALLFAGIHPWSVNVSYRPLAVANTVLFGYASIASFLIPLALAAKLAPKKAEGMTYAYFMALLNISGGFLPDISGAWMFEVLKNMLTYPETTINFLPFSQIVLVIIFAAACIMTIVVFADAEKTADNITSLLLISLVGMIFSYYIFLPMIVDTVVITATYLIQQSYLLLTPAIGQADFLSDEAYRALILRYALIIGAIFTLISTPFVYLLPKASDEEK